MNTTIDKTMEKTMTEKSHKSLNVGENITPKIGQKLKFVVSSAEEAVNLIREQMGPDAKVLSVRQVEGKGLAKFLTAPKLEVIATLPQEEKPAPIISSNNRTNSPPNVSNNASNTALTSISNAKNNEASNVNTAAQNAYAPSVTNPTLPATLRSKAPIAGASTLENVLKAAGFENSLIRRFENSTDWEKLQRIPVKTALSDLARRLRLDYDAVKVPAVTQTIAFLGSSGSGKTTALCKQLAHEVFFERRSVQVLKLDSGAPNADTALALYCEVMGVPLLRESKAIVPTSALLVDTAGINLNDPEEIAALKSKLDALNIKTRVWVVNAAYDNSVIDRSFATAEELGATHTVYTHLDEVHTTSRLWHFVLSGRAPALFGSTGPGVAHDRASDLGSTLLQKTFPDYLLK